MSNADWFLLLLAAALRICRLPDTRREPSPAHRG
jgi:hypothetical protein